MNRNNFLGHLALALTIITFAAFAGQLRRWTFQREEARAVVINEQLEKLEGIRSGPGVESKSAEVIVAFRKGTSDKLVETITRGLNDRVEDRFEHVSGYAVIEDLDGLDVDAVVREYAARPEVEFVEKNMRIELYPEPARLNSYSETLGDTPLNGPNDPLLAEQWALVNTGQHEGKASADISALLAWSKKTGSDEIVVAVLDSGVNYMHPDLVNNMWVRPATLHEYTDEHLGTIDDARGYNAVDNDGNPMDDNGHGTHCSGIIGAEGDNSEGIAGVNWKVQIMPLKFMDANGMGTTQDAIEAINYVIARKKDGVNVRIISASWGSTMYSRALEEAIRRAGEEGILFVAAAGNSGVNNDRMPHYPSSYDLPNMVAVAALTRRDELAKFSNFGPKSVHVAAPGAEILSTWLGSDYEEHSGTSMAAPVVSGVAALVLANDANLSLKELRERLLSSVDRLDALQGKVTSGGRVNAARATGASANRTNMVMLTATTR